MFCILLASCTVLTYFLYLRVALQVTFYSATGQRCSAHIHRRAMVFWVAHVAATEPQPECRILNSIALLANVYR